MTFSCGDLHFAMRKSSLFQTHRVTIWPCANTLVRSSFQKSDIRVQLSGNEHILNFINTELVTEINENTSCYNPTCFKNIWVLQRFWHPMTIITTRNALKSCVLARFLASRAAKCPNTYRSSLVFARGFRPPGQPNAQML